MADNTKAATTTAPAPAATPAEVNDYRAELLAEYGTYVAVADISFNGARAYNAGDAVPTSNVEKHGYLDEGLVALIKDKDGQDVIRRIHAAATADATSAQQPVVSLGVPVPAGK